MESTSNQLQPAPPQLLTDMEAKPSGDPEGAGGAETADVSQCEKPSVPMTSLKMMFERGQTDTVSLLRSSPVRV